MQARADSQAPAAAALPLPQLRAELQLNPAAPAVTGEPLWTIYDPLRHAFVQIDAATHVVLSLWGRCRDGQQLLDALAADGRVACDEERLRALIGFLAQHHLLLPDREGRWKSLLAEQRREHGSFMQRALHNYLFFKVPLCNPERFLARTLPAARLLATPFAIALIWTLGVLGVYLASRQSEEFFATIPDFLNPEGLALMLVALVIVKLAHELGHAYQAAALGCRVPEMGVALIFATPFPYTDVTDAWRLTDRRQRFLIDSAGIRVELALAVLALFLWSFLPPGSARTIAFAVSCVSIIGSLVINLNPFMRFDGYHLLSSMLGVDSLQERAFAIGRWHMREVLFRPRLPCPEIMPRRKRALLIAYAYTTWAYRLVTFTALALIVYHAFFKILGLLLFAIEIYVLLARPMVRELKVWIAMRRNLFLTPRAAITAAVAAALAGLAAVPLSGRVAIPAVLMSAEVRPVHAPRPAMIESIAVAHGQLVRAGEPIAMLTSPAIAQEIRVRATELELARLQLARRGADATDREASMVLENKVAELETRLAGLEQEKRNLVLRAPIDGRIAELNPQLNAGRWISPRERIALVTATGSYRVRGYVPESDIWRIESGAAGTFVPASLQRAGVEVSIARIALSGAADIELPELASPYQGPIEVQPDTRNRLAPRTAHYAVDMTISAPVPDLELMVKGTAFVAGSKESVLAGFWRQTLKVLLRESGA